MIWINANPPRYEALDLQVAGKRQGFVSEYFYGFLIFLTYLTMLHFHVHENGLEFLMLGLGFRLGCAEDVAEGEGDEEVGDG